MSGEEAINRLVLFGDASGSARWGLSTKLQMRRAMYGAFAEAFGAVGVQRGELHQEDRGDGILAALHPAVPPSSLVGRWVDTLYESLRQRNRGSAQPLRMRVALHMGPVARDEEGLIGRPVDLTCRLCDSAVVKRVFAQVPDSPLLVVVSDWVYSQVVLEGGRYVEPDCYRPARVRNKETDELAWYQVPRLPTPPTAELAESPDPEESPEPAGESPDRDGRPRAAPAAHAPTEPASPDGPAGHQPSRVVNHFVTQGDTHVVQDSLFLGPYTGIRKDRDAGESPDQSRADQSRADQSRADQSGADQSGADQSGADQSRTDRNAVGQHQPPAGGWTAGERGAGR